MAQAHSSRKTKKAGAIRSLVVRLDGKSKAYLLRAAKLRRISVSEYVLAVTVAQARREVLAAREQTIALTADEQLAFWNALNASPRLTKPQRRLGSILREEREHRSRHAYPRADIGS